MKTAHVIHAIADHNPDLFYTTHFPATDPYTFIQIGKKNYVIAISTEIDAMRRQVKDATVVSYGDYYQKAKTRSTHPQPAHVIDAFLRDHKIKALVMHPHTHVDLVDGLLQCGYKITVGPMPFFPNRSHKTAEELRAMKQVQKLTFAAIDLAHTMIHDSKIRTGKLWYQGSILTSERVREAMQIFLLQHDCATPEGVIVAGGLQSVEPHNRGSGPLRPYESIIVDVFPRNLKTGFYGDATRTFCKGRAPEALQHQYLAVLTAQEMALKNIRAGVLGNHIHQSIQRLFIELGYTTTQKGKLEGFFHGTGHGLGLALHEEPVRINNAHFALQPGHVVTVEPGLYYRKSGGVRIEDAVVVTQKGCELLGHYPKELQI